MREKTVITAVKVLRKSEGARAGDPVRGPGWERSQGRGVSEAAWVREVSGGKRRRVSLRPSCFLYELKRVTWG